MKLISMTEFVLERKEKWRNKSMEQNGDELYCRSKHSKECEEYANFLTQPLELGMFIPCVDGKPMDEPERYNLWLKGYFVGEFHISSDNYYQYQQAKEKVLFDGFEANEIHLKGIKILINKGYTVEDLANTKGKKPTLTKTAIKQIGL